MNLAWGTRQRVGNGASFASCLFVALVLYLLHFSSASAASGINQQINYQARLLDSTGAVVADGTYNMEFKIYQDGDGALGGGDETLKWTETRTGGNKVTVKNGYFSVQLGSVDNTLGSSVDWNQDTLWLSTNIGGTGTPSWDGEMSPFRRVGAAAYALNSKQLGGLDWSKFVQIAPSAVQADSSTLATLFLNKTGASGNILQLQKNGSDVLSISNAGLATFSQGISVASGGIAIGGDTMTDFTGDGLAVSSNTLAIRLDTTPADGSSTSSTSGLEFVGGELSLLRGCAASEILKWDNTSFKWDCATDQSGGSADLDGVYDNDSDKTLAIDSTSGLIFNMTTTGDFIVQDGGVAVLTVSDSGTMLFKPSADSSTAFEVQKAGSTTQLFIIDSSNDRVYIGDDTADGTGALLVLDTKNTTGDPTGVNGAMYYNSATNEFRCFENSVWWNCIGPSSDRDRRRPLYSMEFLDRSNVATVAPWISAAISSGTTSAQAGTSSHPGRVRITSSTTANSGFRYETDIAAFLISGGESTDFVFNIQTLTNATIRLGFLDSTTSADAVDGAYIEIPSTGAAVCKTSNNSTRTTSSTIATLSTATWYRARISVNSAATSATCEIFNDSSVSQGSQTNNANIPTAAGRETGHGFIATNSGTTATAIVDMDFMSLWWERVLTR